MSKRRRTRTLPAPDQAQRAQALLQGLHDDDDASWDTILFAIHSGTDPALLEALDASGDPTWRVISSSLGHASADHLACLMLAMVADRLRTITEEAS